MCVGMCTSIYADIYVYMHNHLHLLTCMYLRNTKVYKDIHMYIHIHIRLFLSNLSTYTNTHIYNIQ